MSLGIALLLVSLVCLGTWPALLKLASVVPENYTNNDYSSLRASPNGQVTTLSKNPTEVICHAYLDYATAYFLASTIPFLVMTAFTNHQFDVPPLPLVAVAMLGGTLLSLGNLSFQWATAVYEASLTFVLAIQASMTIALGTGINFVLEPEKTKKPHWLIAAVVCFLGAIGLAVQSQLVVATATASDVTLCLEQGIELHTKNKETIPKTLQRPDDTVATNRIILNVDTNDNAPIEQEPRINNNPHLDECDLSNPPASFLPHAPPVATALGVTILGGLAFGFFSPAFNIAVNDPFHWTARTSDDHAHTQDENCALRVACTNLIFSFAFWLASLVGNLLLLKRQVCSSSTTALLQRYLCTSTVSNRRLALSAGLVCAVGNVLQFQGGQLVGYATADLVQAYPLVSTLWDVVWFGEFRTLWCTSRLGSLLFGMYLAYGTGVILFAGSSLED